MGLFGPSISFPIIATATSQAHRAYVIGFLAFWRVLLARSSFDIVLADEMFLEQRRYVAFFFAFDLRHQLERGYVAENSHRKGLERFLRFVMWVNRRDCCQSSTTNVQRQGITPLSKKTLCWAPSSQSLPLSSGENIHQFRWKKNLQASASIASKR